MKFALDALKIIGVVLLVLLIIPLALAFVAYVGYFFGIILAYLASYVLVGYGVEFGTIPLITAWLFVAGSILGVGGKAGSE